MILILIFFLIFTVCTPPPPLITIVKEDTITNYQSFSSSPVKGYGKIYAKINGSILEGTFDMIFKRDSSFSMTFYTWFGTTVGFIRTEKDSIYINLGGEVKKFSFFDNLDIEIVPFFFNIKLSEIVKILSQEIINDLIQEKTFEIKENKNRIFYVWKKNNIQYTGVFLKKTGTIKKFIIEKDSNNKNKKIIEFKKFYGNFAKNLSFYADGQNYFYLRYDNIKRVKK